MPVWYTVNCVQWRRIEVVVTSLTRNQVVRKGTWVRIPPSPPEIKNPHAGQGSDCMGILLCAFFETTGVSFSEFHK